MTRTVTGKHDSDIDGYEGGDQNVANDVDDLTIDVVGDNDNAEVMTMMMTMMMVIMMTLVSPY